MTSEIEINSLGSFWKPLFSSLYDFHKFDDLAPTRRRCIDSENFNIEENCSLFLFAVFLNMEAETQNH